MQQLNSANEDQNIGGDIGVFSVGADRLIGQNSSFLDSVAPNYVSIAVATSALQYVSSMYAYSVRLASQTSI